MNSLKDICDNIIQFSKDRCKDNHPRDDYRELLELIIIFLGVYCLMVTILKHRVPSIMLDGWLKQFIA
jgi:hypothetical protein